MRLIDADKLKTHTTGTSNYNEFTFVYKSDIDNAPTVCDIDKIRDEISKEILEYKDLYTEFQDDVDYGIAEGLDKSLDIIGKHIN